MLVASPAENQWLLRAPHCDIIRVASSRVCVHPLVADGGIFTLRTPNRFRNRGDTRANSAASVQGNSSTEDRPLFYAYIVGHYGLQLTTGTRCSFDFLLYIIIISVLLVCSVVRYHYHCI